MTVKKQPATPLPWRLFEDGGVGHGYTVEISPPEPARLGERPAVIGWSGFDSCGLKAREQQANARYIVHAANAYPRLIEHYLDALLLLRGWIAKHCPEKYRAEHLADLERKRALLTELGEAK